MALPALHQIFHHVEHVHAGAGMRFPSERRVRTVPETPPHGHDGHGWHTHGSSGAGHPDKATPHPDPKPKNPRKAEPDHGSGTLSHYSYVLGEGAPAPIRLASVLLVLSPAVAPPAAPVLQLGFLAPPPARGPPVG